MLSGPAPKLITNIGVMIMTIKITSSMKILSIIFVLINSICPTVAIAAEYEIDPSHTFIQFQISHLGFSTLNGRFNQMSGNFNWDMAKPDASTIQIEINTDSIDTNWAERDKHLRGEDFLEIDKYPTASFKSSKFTDGKLEGTLTLHGVSKPITMDMQAVGEGDDPWGGYRAGFDATTTLRRSDFELNYDLGPAAETMSFSLHVEGIRK